MKKRILRFGIWIMSLFCLCVGCGSKGDEETGGITQEVTQAPEDGENSSTPESVQSVPEDSGSSDENDVIPEPPVSEVLCDSMGNPYDEIIIPDGCVVESDYLRIEFPAYWEGKFLYTVSQDRTITFYHRASYEYFLEHGETNLSDMGFLGSIRYEVLETVEYLIDEIGAVLVGSPISTPDGVYAYYSYGASDVRFPTEDDEIADEYISLSEIWWYGVDETIAAYTVVKDAADGAEETYDNAENLRDEIIIPDGCVIENDYLRIELPAYWEGKFLYTVSEDRTITFYHRASYEYFLEREEAGESDIGDLYGWGFLGSIRYDSLENVETIIDGVGGVILGEVISTPDGDYAYVSIAASDVPIPVEKEELVEEYVRLSQFWWYEADEYIEDCVIIKDV